MRRLTGDPTEVWTILAGGSSAWQAARHPVAPGASHAPNVPSPSPSPCSLQLATCNLQLRIILKVAQLTLLLASEGPCRGSEPLAGIAPPGALECQVVRPARDPSHWSFHVRLCL